MFDMLATYVCKMLLFSAFALPLCAAVTVTAPEFPAPAWAGREQSQDLSLPAGTLGADAQRFSLSFVFATNGAERVRVSLGADAAPVDGLLSPAETDMELSFFPDGSVALRPCGLRESYLYAPSAPAPDGARLFRLEARVRKDGSALSFGFWDGGSPAVFGGLDLSGGVPAWLRPAAWTLMRVTRTGGTGAEETVPLSAAYSRDGGVIYIH